MSRCMFQVSTHNHRNVIIGDICLTLSLVLLFWLKGARETMMRTDANVRICNCACDSRAKVPPDV